MPNWIVACRALPSSLQAKITFKVKSKFYYIRVINHNARPQNTLYRLACVYVRFVILPRLFAELTYDREIFQNALRVRRISFRR